MSETLALACIYCDCTDFDACDPPCSWASLDPPVCDAPPCLDLYRRASSSPDPDRPCSAPGRLRLDCSKRARYVATGRDGLQWFTCEELDHQVEAKTLVPIAAWFAELAR